MKYLQLAAFLFLFTQVSCKQKKADEQKAYSFYDSVNQHVNINKPDQQAFIDKITFALLAARDNKTVIIDTKGLQELLDKARSKNIEIEKNIEKITEFDNGISYKKNVMTYVRTFSDAYQNEFPQTIRILAETKDDRYERASALLLPILQRIKENQVLMENARDEFKARYQRPEKRETIKTGDDYEFVKLKDFVFTMAGITNGAKIKLLSFSGDEDPGKDRILYSQFIGIDLSTGDTLRILSLAGLQQYDLDKASRIGTFKSDLPIRDQMTPGESEFIIFNKNQSDLERGNYKTAFGILTFN